MKKIKIPLIPALFAILCVPAFYANADDVIFSHTFDGVDNEVGPALQVFNNGAGETSFDLATGELSGHGTSGAPGFNTVSGIDLSAYAEFTIEYVVENNYSDIASANLNGTFFGIANSETANATDGSALFNNAGSPVGTAIGLQVGPGRGDAGADFVLDEVGGNGVFTAVSAPSDDATDGYSIFVTYAEESGTGNTAVTITSIGLDSDFDFGIVAETNYSELASEVTPNVSTQGGTLDLSSITIRYAVLDSDDDGIPNTEDPDDDNDGVDDVADAFPLDPNEDTDTDDDGIGNNADTDDDNDGILDDEDDLPLDPTNALVAINVSSLEELMPYLDDDNVLVTLAPGTYRVTASDITSGAIGAMNPVVSGGSILLIEGSNSIFDFTGVTIEVETAVFNAFGGGECRELHIMGNYNVVKNLTITDIGSVYDYPRNGALGILMDGIENRIEGVHLSLRGSWPYGYGDSFGKGGTYTIKHYKHSGLLIRGRSNHAKDCTIISRSYGHVIFMQGAESPIVEGCYVEGELRSTDDMLAETSGPAYDIDFMTDWGYRLPAGYTMSLQEEGIRAYNAGRSIINGVQLESKAVSDPTVINCTVKRVRGGITLSHATGTKTVIGCTTIECEQGYAIGSGTIEDSSADAKYGPALGFAYSSDSYLSADITILDSSNGNNVSGSLAYIGGNNHNITFRGNSDVAEGLQIDVTGPRDTVRRIGGDTLTASNGTINNLTGYPVVLGEDSSGMTVSSVGAVTDNGTDNTVTAATSEGCGGFAADQVIESEDFCEQSGIELIDMGDGNSSVGSIDDGDWIKFNQVFFGAGPELVHVEVASSGEGGSIEFRIGAIDGELMGAIAVGATGALSDWERMTASVDRVMAVEDLYLVFKTPSSDLYRIDSFQFAKDIPLDTDSDGLADSVDTDDDGDGVEDSEDAFPLDPSEYVDSDSDGIGDNADPDDDNNGILDVDEVSEFINISTRTYILDGEKVAIAGFVIEGTDAMTVLIQGVGPELSGAPYSLNEVLSDPMIGLYDETGTVMLENDDWEDSDATMISDVSSLVGAFKLQSGSTSSAMVTTLDPGVYTVIVSSADGSAGIGLVEVYNIPISN